MSKGMSDKLVGVLWDPTGVVRAFIDGGNEDAEHVSYQLEKWVRAEWPAAREQMPRSMYITGGMINQYGPAPGCSKCRSVTCLVRIEGREWSKDPSARDRMSRTEERKTRCMAKHPEQTSWPSGGRSAPTSGHSRPSRIQEHGGKFQRVAHWMGRWRNVPVWRMSRERYPFQQQNQSQCM